jgi:heme exporter protein B
MRQLGWLLWKDALTEVRGLERLGTLVLFAVVVMLTLQFSLAPGSSARPLVAAGFLWAALVFAGTFEFRRAFETERTDGTLDGLRLAPIDPTVIYIAKMLSSLVVVALLTAILVPLTALFFTGHARGIPPAIGIALLGSTGFIAWGTLFGAVVGSARASDIVLPVLLFPLVVPQTIATVRLLSFYLSGEALGSLGTGYVLLGAFDLLALGTSVLLFGYVLDE